MALKMTANPQRALDLNVNASLEFLRMVMPGIPHQMEDAFPREGILCEDAKPLEMIPSAQLHKPQDEKWIAARLSVPHEFLWRVVPGYARKVARAKVQAEGGKAGEEVWVHSRPTNDAIKDYSTRVKGKRMGCCGQQCAGKHERSSSVAPQSVPCNDGRGEKRGNPQLAGQSACG